MEKKNYYDWLEISKNASPEVIDKAYKALVKKYHPDLQEGENKLKAEEIIKHINEAYAILSDEVKRKQYDETIKEETISREDYDRLQEELNTMKRQSATNNYQANYQNYNVNSKTNYNTNDNISNENSQSIERKRQELEYQQQLENARRKAYHDAYIQELKSRGYRIRYKKTFKDYLRVFIVIFVIIVCCIIIWMIPFTREKLIEFYENNEVIKWIVDIIINMFKTIFNIQ